MLGGLEGIFSLPPRVLAPYPASYVISPRAVVSNAGLVIFQSRAVDNRHD